MKRIASERMEEVYATSHKTDEMIDNLEMQLFEIRTAMENIEQNEGSMSIAISICACAFIGQSNCSNCSSTNSVITGMLSTVASTVNSFIHRSLYSQLFNTFTVTILLC